MSWKQTANGFLVTHFILPQYITVQTLALLVWLIFFLTPALASSQKEVAKSQICLWSLLHNIS